MTLSLKLVMALKRDWRLDMALISLDGLRTITSCAEKGEVWLLLGPIHSLLLVAALF